MSNPVGPADSNPVQVLCDGATVTLRVNGHLDEDAGARLLALVSAELLRCPRRIDVDLRGVLSHTAAGARTLGTCRDLGSRLDEGLHFRTDQGPGMAAFLEGCEVGDTLSTGTCEH